MLEELLSIESERSLTQPCPSMIDTTIPGGDLVEEFLALPTVKGTFDARSASGLYGSMLERCVFRQGLGEEDHFVHALV